MRYGLFRYLIEMHNTRCAKRDIENRLLRVENFDGTFQRTKNTTWCKLELKKDITYDNVVALIFFSFLRNTINVSILVLVIINVTKQIKKNNT